MDLLVFLVARRFTSPGSKPNKEANHGWLTLVIHVFRVKLFQDSSVQNNSLGTLTLGLLTLLVARGIYLWLLNLSLILYLFTAARALHKYLNEQVSDYFDCLV